MYDQQNNNQYFNFIKNAGYQYSKDNLGFYFDNGLKRFSVMPSGPIFKCYYNIKSNGQWVLKDRNLSALKLVDALQWILSNIQKG